MLSLRWPEKSSGDRQNAIGCGSGVHPLIGSGDTDLGASPLALQGRVRLPRKGVSVSVKTERSEATLGKEAVLALAVSLTHLRRRQLNWGVLDWSVDVPVSFASSPGNLLSPSPYDPLSQAPKFGFYTLPLSHNTSPKRMFLTMFGRKCLE